MTRTQDGGEPVATPRGRLAARLPSGDQGVAMVLVLGVALVLSALVAATLALTVGGVRNARYDQDWQASLPAAEAGIDHYLSRINSDGTYWGYGNPSDPFSSGSSVTLPTGANANPAFSGWTEVPGSAGRAQFRYAVNTTAFFTTGVIRLQSTGRVGSRTRTVETTIGRRNFIDYLYFTDYEAQDPSLYVAGTDSYNATDATTHCSRHLYDQVAGSIRLDRVNSDIANRSSGCTNINFVGPRPGFAGDTINGPFHSNDAVYICSTPTITAEASTSYDGSLTGGRRHVRNVGCGTTNVPQIAASGNDFVYKAPLTLPPDNKDLSRQVDPAYTAPAAPGCLYTGPTEIVFTPGATMTVSSPWSKNGGPAFCGTGTGIPVPARGVIWVRDVPATADAYSLPAPALVAGASCDGTHNPLGYPRRVAQGGGAPRTDRTPYDCFSGDAIVSGSMSGRVTVGAENNVVIADDLRYANTSCSASSTCTDVLGLIANNFVETMHPYGCRDDGSSCQNLSTAQTDLVVEAAILSVTHGFRTQNHSVGAPLGTLTVRGAIGQKYRGTVGTTGGSGTGYSKNYNYDWRLRYASPPYFLDPVKSSYGQKTWAEPQAAYPASP